LKIDIDSILSKKIKFYKKLNKEERNELWDLLSNYEKYSINLKYQKKIGFGIDKFTLNELGIRKIDLSSYKNLKVWDKEQYTYQKKHGQTHLDETYKLYLFGDWCRFIENKKLIYGEIFSVHSYIFDKVTQKLSKFENGLFPHTTKFKFIKNKKKTKHPLSGKSEYMYSMKSKTKAYGREKDLEQFQKLRREFEHNVLAPKIKKYILKNMKKSTYRIVQTKETFDNFHQFLFSDNKALKHCRFETFLDDFNALKRDDRELKKIEKKFFNYSKEYLMKKINSDTQTKGVR